MLISILTPALNESKTLGRLYVTIEETFRKLAIDFEWIIIDDHSSDGTFSVIQELSQADSRVRGYRFARNFGAHTALFCGFEKAQGDAVLFLAADGQDPPNELIPKLLNKWELGSQVVWATRTTRPGESWLHLLGSQIYYFCLRHFAGMANIPPSGAGCFLLDKKVVETLQAFPEKNASIFALVSWLGFRQSTVEYGRSDRHDGKSRWTLEKKIKLFIDSITSFSYLPVRLMSACGALVSLGGFAYAGYIIFRNNHQAPMGWASLMVVVLVLCGTLMLMMGVLGEYLWRTLDEARGRPRYWLEAVTEPNIQLSKSSEPPSVNIR